MAFLKVLESPDPALKDQTIPLAGKEVLIGRGKENGLVLEDHAVSRHHARIVEEPDGHVLVDNNSANGSWVNGQRVTEQRLKPGDQIRVGKTLFEIQGVYDPEGTALLDVQGMGMSMKPAPAPVPRRPPAARRHAPSPHPPRRRRRRVSPAPSLRAGHRLRSPCRCAAGASADADSGPDSRSRPARADAAARSDGRPRPAPMPPPARPRWPPRRRCRPRPCRLPRPRLLRRRSARRGRARRLLDPVPRLPDRQRHHLGLLMGDHLGPDDLHHDPGGDERRGAGRARGDPPVPVVPPRHGRGSRLHPLVLGQPGATPGKKMLGLKIVREDGEEPLGWGTAFMRLVGYMVSGFILYIGFLMIAFNPDKKGLHDMIAKTRVLKIR